MADNIVDNNSSNISNRAADNNSNNNGVEIVAPLPKHIPFPDFSGTSSELLNEFVMFLFITCSAGLQFINLFRTIWWLPESYTHHTVNFHLIDHSLVVLIILITSRRFIYCSLIYVIELLQRRKRINLLNTKIVKYSYLILLLSAMGICIYKMFIKYNHAALLTLCFPFIVYLCMFRFQIEPFLRTICEVEGNYFNGMPMHCCSSNPTNIREEIEILKNDFNNRLKQILFTSMMNAYYSGFIPCFFAKTVYFNWIWIIQHIIFVLLSCVTMCAMFLFPAKYSDILHRASLHLGYWIRLDVGRFGVAINPAIVNDSDIDLSKFSISSSSSTSSSFSTVTRNADDTSSTLLWNKNLICSNGSIVKYGNEFFHCIGPATVALPGNATHSRFYKLFHNPSIIYMTLTTVQATIVITEIMLLYFVTEWHFVLSMSFIALTNQFTFFKIFRDYLITKRVYTSETSIGEKNSLHFN